MAAGRSRHPQGIRASGPAPRLPEPGRYASAQAPLITQADNGKTICVRVGGTVTVLLSSNDSSRWLQPLASGSALKPAPSGEGSLVKGVTGAWFTAARPGQVLVTSVRPPCEVAISGGKGDLQPDGSVPKSYPLRFCAPGHRFSVSIVVAD